MHEPAGVDGGEPFGQVGGEFRHPGGTQRTGGVDPILEGRGGDVGGDHPGTFGARIGVDHLDRVEPADHAGGRDLAGEPLTERRLPGVLRPDELDRDQAPGPGPAEEHLAHPALAEQAGQPVAADTARITRAQRADPGRRFWRYPRL